jgi:hypothetical protein
LRPPLAARAPRFAPRQRRVLIPYRKFSHWTVPTLTGIVTVMPTANLTVSLDPAVIEMAKAQAAQRGMAASAWVAKLIRDASLVEASRRYDEYDRSAGDADAMTAWDAVDAVEQDQRLAGAEW